MRSEKRTSSKVIRPHSSGLAGLMRIFDVLVVVGGLWGVCRAHGIGWGEHYTVAAAWASVLFVLIAENEGLYRSWRLGGLRQEVGQVVIVWVAMALALLVFGYVTKTSAELSRRVFLTWCAGGPSVLAGSRIAVRWFLRAVRANERNQQTAAVAGAGELGRRVAKTIRSQPWMGLKLVGFYDDRQYLLSQVRGKDPLEIRGTLDDLVVEAQRGELDVVYLTLPMRAEKRMKTLARELAMTRVSVYFVPDLLAFSLLRSRWFTLGAIPTVSLFETPFGGVERLLKRVEDVILGTLILAIALFPILLIAAGVKLTSRGPVIFKQRRYGLDGREIIVWKFRTMVVCEDGAAFRQARREDPRVTRFGRLLRATSLDELPQFFNVLQGRMSIVGPRPHPLLLDEQHREAIDWYMLRHRVKPGITGWAQINGFRGETETAEKMRRRIELDLAYIRDWSLGLDLKIIMLTPLVSFLGKNAY